MSIRHTIPFRQTPQRSPIFVTNRVCQRAFDRRHNWVTAGRGDAVAVRHGDAGRESAESIFASGSVNAADTLALPCATWA